jgi:hypothetical protein
MKSDYPYGASGTVPRTDPVRSFLKVLSQPNVVLLIALLVIGILTWSLFSYTKQVVTAPNQPISMSLEGTSDASVAPDYRNEDLQLFPPTKAVISLID